MKAQLKQVNTHAINSFSVRNDIMPQYHNVWHYHEEIELIHFEKGSGTQFIGDSVKSFSSGDIALVGSNLPHYWLFDDIYLEENTGSPGDIRVIHFKEDFWGKDFLNLPENKKIKDLLREARRGLSIQASHRAQVKQLMENLLLANGTSKIISLLQILQVLTISEATEPLATDTFALQAQENDASRMGKVMNHIALHYKGQIKLPEIASLAGMTANSFCRYFKIKSGKTLFQFLIEMRIRFACKLLIENQLTIKEICFECGFQNFASFHKYFKQIMHTTPLNYQKLSLR